MRKLIFIILIVIFYAIYHYSHTLHDGSIVPTSISEAANVIKKSTFFVKQAIIGGSSQPESLQSASSDSSMNEKNFSENLQELTTEQLKKWVESEARPMNSTNHDTESKEVQLRGQAQTLSNEQLVTLKELAVNSHLPINDRILSAYLISLNLSDQSQEALFNVAKTAIPDFGAILPHSEAELRNSQELAIRYMQIDELFQRAKTDANAIDKLKLLAQEAESAQVRSYAQKKIKELK